MKLHASHHRPLSQSLPDEPGASARAIRRVVKIGCAVNALLMALKLTAGYLGHSDALVADGFHSLNDVAADLIMLVFIGISYRAADARFAYGYGKFETFSSFLMSTLLIVISVMIGAEAVESIVGYARGETLPQPDIWTFVVVLFCMACKEGLFRFYSHAGRKADSKALVANAWHHRSDAMSSGGTLVGIAGAMFLGDRWRILDPLAAIVVSLFIIKSGYDIMRPCIGELLEASLPEEEEREIEALVRAVPGIEDVHNLRTRRIGNGIAVDLHARADGRLSLAEAHDKATEAENAVRRRFGPNSIINIHMEPTK